MDMTPPTSQNAAQPNGPDFSDIDSRAKAEDRFHRGELEKLFLLPLEFGGSDDPMNTVYVPVRCGAIKANIDNNIIRPLAAERRITKYNASPEYQGVSFIPNAIKIVASDPGRFSTVIQIWGEALTRRDDG
jgi:hypothetical protein